MSATFFINPLGVSLTKKKFPKHPTMDSTALVARLDALEAEFRRVMDENRLLREEIKQREAVASLLRRGRKDKRRQRHSRIAHVRAELWKTRRAVVSTSLECALINNKTAIARVVKMRSEHDSNEASDPVYRDMSALPDPERARHNLIKTRWNAKLKKFMAKQEAYNLEMVLPTERTCGTCGGDLEACGHDVDDTSPV